MQALIISATVAICLSLAILIFPSDLKAGPNVLDIQELKGLGLTDTTIEEIVTVSLRPRARKPLDADFIKLMAAYGGDGLTSAYLELDSLTAAYPNAPIGRDTIQRLIAAKVAKGEIIAMIRKAIDNTKKDDSQMAPSAGEEDRSSGISHLAGAGMAGAGLALGAGVSELNRSESAQSLPATAASSSYSGLSGTTAPPGIWTPEAEDFSEIDSQNIPQARILEAESLENIEPLSRDSLEEEKLPKPVNDSLKQIESEELPALNAELTPDTSLPSGLPSEKSQDINAMSLGDAVLPLSIGDAGAQLAESAVVTERPISAPVEEKVDPRLVPQRLYRGQKADPARPMPRGGTLYPVREPQEDDEYFMGSYRYETLDGHQVDVHRASHSNILGTRVESRASGQKVHRYFSGRPERKVGKQEVAPRSAIGGTPNEIVDYFE